MIAAVDHLARRRTEALRAEAAALPVGPHRLDRLIDTHALLTSWKRQLAIIIRT